MASRPRRRALPLAAAALSLGWVVMILPVIHPVVARSVFGPEPVASRFLGPAADWLDVWVRCGRLLGSAVASLATMAWAWWAGAFDPKIGFWKPWKVESWILDVSAFGGLFGGLVAAVLPTWAIWWWSRVVTRPPAPPRTPPSLRAALHAAATTAIRHPAACVLLAALAIVATHAGDAAGWFLGRRGSVPSPSGSLVGLGIGAIVGLASARLALASIDEREWDAGDLLGNPARTVAYVTTTAALSIGVGLGLLLGVVPGVALGVTFGFAPFVAAENGGLPDRAFARSAALTRGVRWPLLGIGVAIVGLPVAIVALLARANPAGPKQAALVLVYDVVLAPLSVLVCAHLYRQLIASLPERGTQQAARLGWRHDPALAVAAAWSIALVVPFGWSVMQRARHPNPAWLMLPPLRDGRADLTVPLSGWCPYSRHASASGCRWILTRAGKSLSFHGYAFDGAGCFPVEDVRVASPHDRIVGHIEGVLRRAVGSAGVVQRSGRVGSDELDFVIFARDEDGTPFPIVAIDVGGPDLEGLDRARLARLATAGLPEYWSVSEPYEGVPAMVTVMSEPDRQARGYMRSRGSGGGGHDPEMKPIRLGAMRLEANDLVPPGCPPGPEAAPAPAPFRGCDDTLAFVLDGTSPAPSVELAGSGDLRFTGVSSAPPGFDPPRTALRVRMHGSTYPRTEVLDASLPRGARWRTAARGSAWTYDDPAGRSGGLTHVAIARTDPGESRFGWEIEARPRRAAVSPPAVLDWVTLVVTMTLPGFPDGPGACGSVFFPVRSSSDGCILSATRDSVRCTVPSAAPACAATDLDGMVRCTVDETARAQDAYFARRGAYFSGACDDLPGVGARPGVLCSTAGTAASFSVTAFHPRMKTACRLESAKGPLMDCS